MFSAWAPTSFRGRMALLFGFLSLLVGLPTYLYGSAVHREQLLHDRHAALNAQASSAATVIAENMIERRREIELLAQTPLYRHAPLDSPEFQASLERLQRSYPYYSWIGIAAPDGVVLAATSGAIIVRLGGERLRPADAPADAEPPSAQPSTPGMEPHIAHLASVVGLVWRSVVLWMLFLALATLAGWRV